MTLQQAIAARRAYLIAQVMESTPNITRDEAERILDSVCSKPKPRKAAA